MFAIRPKQAMFPQPQIFFIYHQIRNGRGDEFGCLGPWQMLAQGLGVLFIPFIGLYRPIIDGIQGKFVGIFVGIGMRDQKDGCDSRRTTQETLDDDRLLLLMATSCFGSAKRLMFEPVSWSSSATIGYQ